jgi:hypothetical protein
MSKLFYFLGGALAGVIGTAIAAYAVDACSYSDADEWDGQKADAEEPAQTDTAAMEDDAFSEPDASPA